MNETENPFLDSRIKCKNCDTPIPASAIIQRIQSSLLISFAFAFCLAFTVLTIANDVRHHYSADSNAQTVAPYSGAMFFAGLISFLSWVKVKRKRILEVSEKIKRENG